MGLNPQLVHKHLQDKFGKDRIDWPGPESDTMHIIVHDTPVKLSSGAFLSQADSKWKSLCDQVLTHFGPLYPGIHVSTSGGYADHFKSSARRTHELRGIIRIECARMDEGKLRTLTTIMEQSGLFSGKTHAAL